MKKIINMLLTAVMIFTINIATTKALEPEQIPFDLSSTVYNYGEAIDKIILDTSAFDIDTDSISTDTFKIYATATTPYTDPDILDLIAKDGLAHFGLYSDVERQIESISYENGKIILNLVTTKDTAGKGTLDFTANSETQKGCNLSVDIDYRIELNSPIELADGTQLNSTDIQFTQNDGIINDEISQFTAGELNGFKYQFYTPENADDGQKHPLIVWFHGGGESGYKGVLYNNESQLKANRGAVCFTTAEAQEIFGGAYVLAPQTPNEWSDSLDDAKSLIDEIIKNNNIDTNRIYAYGCSAGGYMTLDMVVKNPDFFAAAVATCPAIDQANINRYGEGRIITDEELLSTKNTPIWVIQAKNDTTVKYEESALRIYNLLKDQNAILTSYENVTVDGDKYSGHEAWVYTALNMPENNGEHVWQWSARQTLKTPETVTDTETSKTESPANQKTESVKTGDTSLRELYLVLSTISLTVMGYQIFRRKMI